MARIDWAVLCDSVFLDRQDRLCVIGIVRKLTVPSLPSAVRQFTHAARTGSEHVVIEVADEYIFAGLREVPLLEEGAHRFENQATRPACGVG